MYRGIAKHDGRRLKKKNQFPRISFFFTNFWILIPLLPFFFAPVSWASTNISGTISVDTVWTVSGSPYIVMSDAYVKGSDGADGITTLTIEPGVEVRFNKNTRLEIGASSGDPGALVAEGTSGDPILFTSNEISPAAGDWYAIRFLNTTHDTTTRLSQCIVEYATYNGSIYIYSSSPTIENTIIRHSSKYGIYLLGTSSPTVTGCTISNVANYGLYFASAADGSFTNNTIEKGFYHTSGGFDALTGNTFNWDNTYPIRIGCDYVGQLVNNNIFVNLDANSYLEVNGGTITRDSTWLASLPYRILTSITIQGTDGTDGVTTLTLDPGVTMRFNSSQHLAIGASSGSPGALVAEGTAAEPIVFTSAQTTPAAGDWYGIRFLTTTHDATTRLSQCIVEYATYGTTTGSLYIYYSSPTIENTIIRHSPRYGIYITGTSSPTVTGCTISDVANYGLYFASAADGSFTNNTIEKGFYHTSGGFDALTGNTFNWDNAYPIRIGCDYVGQLVNNNTFANLDANSYLEVIGGTITKDSTWNTSIPYRILTSITIQGTDGADGVTTLTLSPGVIMRFNPAQSIDIGNSSGSPGALVAEGTAAEPIVFTSANTTPTAGDWYGIHFLDTTHDATTRLSQCIVEYATYTTSYGSLFIRDSSPTIENTIIRHSPRYGIYITGTSSPTVTGCTISDVANYGLYFASAADGSFTNNTIENGFYLTSGGLDALAGNTFNWNNAYPIRIGCDYVGQLVNNNTFANLGANSNLEVIGGTITRDSTWPALLPYRILTSITIQGTDGTDGVTTLTLDPGVTMWFNPGQSITIGNSSGSSGALLAEGTVAEPIVFTSAQTTPAAGDWNGIYFANTADDTQCLLSYCDVAYAGMSGYGGIRVIQSNPAISSTRIHHSPAYGLSANNADITLTDCEIDNNGSYGVYIASCAPDIIRTDFHDNGDFDIYYSGSPTGGNITGNTIRNGIFVINGTLTSITSNTIEYNDSKPFYLIADFVGAFFKDNTVTGVTSSSIMHVYADTITRDASWPSAMLFRIHGNITVQGTDGVDGVTTLTIGAGATLKFDASTRLTIGGSSGDPGALVAEGTTAEPIVFTSAQAIPAAGDWNGIYFANTADDDLCLLSHCEVGYAGTASYGGIHVYQCSPEISDTRVHHSSGYGIYAYYADITLTDCEIDNSGSYGVYIASCAPDIIGTDFHDNGDFDIYFSGSPTGGNITGNTIRNGIYVVNGTLSSITGNTIEYNDSKPFYLLADYVDAFFSANTVTGVTSTSIMHVYADTITKDASWPSTMLYRIHGDVTIQGTDGGDEVTTLTIGAGATLKFDTGKQFTVGGSSGDPGALVAVGTAASPIVFTSVQTTPAAGDWDGVYFYDTADDSQCVMSHCEVAYAGTSSYGAIRIVECIPDISNTRIHHGSSHGISIDEADVTVTDCEIDNNGSYGIYIDSCAPDIIGSDFHGNGNYDIYYYLNPTGGTIAGNTIRNGFRIQNGTLSSIAGNTFEYNDAKPVSILAELVGEFLNDNTITDITSESALHVWGSDITRDTTWPALMPVRMRSNVTVQGTDGVDGVTTLTIGAGAVLKFDTGIRLTVGASSGDPGAIVADGSQGTIVFTSAQETPAAGDWDRIQFSGTSDDGICFLKNCIFEYGGSGSYGTVYCVDASPTILYCRFINGAHAGLYLSSDGSSDATIGNNDFSGNLYGIYLTGNAQPVLNNNNFLGNTNYGLYNASSVLVTAENNWWGDIGGPSVGDAVYGNVDFDPWSTSQSAGWPTAEFSAFPKATTGGASTLTWSTTNATSVTIAPGIGAVTLIGSMEVSPGETTVYTLTATGPAGSVSKDATVTVYIVSGPEGITYEYDALGRITRIVRNPGSGE